MRLRAIVLVVATAIAVVALVVGIRAGREEVADRVAPQGAAPATDGPAHTTARAKLSRIGNFDEPVYVTAPASDSRRVFVVEKGGRIRVLVGGKLRKGPFLDISGQTSKTGEQGLLSMAFAPDYANTGKFYVDFTDRNGDTRIQEFQRSSASADRASKSSARQLLMIKQPFANHNGGLVAFGPDKLLYVGMGDGGDAGDPGNRAQDLDSPLGKLLRIDPAPSGGRPYTVPESNPFVGKAGRDEIYAYGLRNPWRYSFDRKTGDLYIADVGQDAFEEVDFVARGTGKGDNYGWSCREGRHAYDSSRDCPNPVGPVLETSHGAGNCSITGGVVVRDPKLASLAGRYLYGDYCNGRLFSFKISGGRATGNRALGPSVEALTSFGEDARGRVYVTSQEGPVYRLKS